MERSRYGHYHRVKTPMHKRSRMLKGAFEDRGKYYRCFNCGQIFDITKISAGGVNGTTYSRQIQESPNPIGSGDPFNVLSTLDTIFNQGLAMELNDLGEYVLDEDAVYVPSVVAGCPLCGTRNLP